ncbi:TetR/AcrR family transcriptional regulator [Herbiconiux sp. CPCC 203407]|uniref:TetR/AcrR family transcriptional regulator n=1 Tax=Herbiconiux oxytropis TaxID=2970915 RepID=A0AA42BWN4_9MICO|nr:TetR/AcrR family transcriptional regulator [Herbiconiux oxytropis]MCS5721690.1 TetR/AcrR family transcriptional regulator [Herbiconiux oxytropis]MCS5726683.1 TetR/AcrR family transcriptional regulator [Herbiconiux oxytropis]
MSVATQPLGRREREKQAKLARITAAASELFAKRGVDEVTTQQIADAADIGTGTLFLYAKTKGELLLLVQNARYADALTRGRKAAKAERTTLDALLALLAPIAECNRAQVDNGRTYLREMVFGDSGEPHHAEALSIVARTEEAIADILAERAGVAPGQAATLARVISAIQFLELAASVNTGSTVPDLLASIRAQVAAILPG